MRIAYVSVDPGVSVFGPHGASVHIQEIVREFAAQGHEVTIFTTRRGDLVYERYSLFNTVIAEVNQPGVLEVNSPLLDLQRAHRDVVGYAIWAAAVAQEQWQLRIVGDGPQRVPLMDLAEKLRVDADFRGGEPFGDSRTVARFGDWGCAVPGNSVRASLFFPIAGL